MADSLPGSQDCMCDYGGRECCPLHITPEDEAEWARFVAEDGDDD